MGYSSLWETLPWERLVELWPRPVRQLDRQTVHTSVSTVCLPRLLLSPLSPFLAVTSILWDILKVQHQMDVATFSTSRIVRECYPQFPRAPVSGWMRLELTWLPPNETGHSHELKFCGYLRMFPRNWLAVSPSNKSCWGKLSQWVRDTWGPLSVSLRKSLVSHSLTLRILDEIDKVLKFHILIIFLFSQFTFSPSQFLQFQFVSPSHGCYICHFVTFVT